MKIYIDRVNFNFTTRVWIVDDSARERRILYYENGLWSSEIPKEGYEEKPSLVFPGELGQIFMQAMAEALANQGIKTENDHKIQGTLDATKYHLEDLRKLLKLKVS